MAFFVKVIPPGARARIHSGDCDHCRDGRGQEKQDKGSGPTYWQPKFPEPGYQTVAEAQAFMDSLGPRYTDTGACPYCMKAAGLVIPLDARDETSCTAGDRPEPLHDEQSR